MWRRCSWSEHGIKKYSFRNIARNRWLPSPAADAETDPDPITILSAASDITGESNDVDPSGICAEVDESNGLFVDGCVKLGELSTALYVSWLSVLFACGDDNDDVALSSDVSCGDAIFCGEECVVVDVVLVVTDWALVEGVTAAAAAAAYRIGGSCGGGARVVDGCDDDEGRPALRMLAIGC